MNVCCLISFPKGHNFTEILTQLSKVIILYMQKGPHKQNNDPSLASFRLMTGSALTLVTFQLMTKLVSQAIFQKQNNFREIHVLNAFSK